MDISVVVATCNRAERLRRCLASLARQTIGTQRLEVDVVVDGATDHTLDVIRQAGAALRLRVIEQQNQGDCAAKNRGVCEASGRYCLFLDDDIMADAGLVAAHLAAQQEHGDILGVGRIRLEVAEATDACLRLFAAGWEARYRRYGGADFRRRSSWFRAGPGRVTTGVRRLVRLTARPLLDRPEAAKPRAAHALEPVQ